MAEGFAGVPTVTWRVTLQVSLSVLERQMVLIGRLLETLTKARLINLKAKIQSSVKILSETYPIDLALLQPLLLFPNQLGRNSTMLLVAPWGRHHLLLYLNHHLLLLANPLDHQALRVAVAMKDRRLLYSHQRATTFFVERKGLKKGFTGLCPVADAIRRFSQQISTFSENVSELDA